MSWKNWLLGRKEVTGEITEAQAVDILKRCGFWDPLPGTKGALSPKLFFPYFGAVAFAVDADRAAAFLRDPRVPPIVHVIHDEGDVAIYADADTRRDAIASGYCSPSVGSHNWIVVRR